MTAISITSTNVGSFIWGFLWKAFLAGNWTAARCEAIVNNFMAETIKGIHALGSGCDVKKRIVRPDGEIRYVRCVGIPVLDNGVLKGFLGTAMDVMEHELLTRELRWREAYSQKLKDSARQAVSGGDLKTERLFEC